MEISKPFSIFAPTKKTYIMEPKRVPEEPDNRKMTILTTDIFTIYNHSYSDYEEYCEDEGKEPQGKDSQDYWDWCSNERDANYESDLENIEYTKEYKVPVEIVGCLGLWDGSREIEPMECDDVASAIKRCFTRSIDDIDVYWRNGIIEVYAHHHDGTNCFTIRRKDGEKLPYLYEI